MLTESQLRQVMPNLSPAKVALLLPHLNGAMAEYGINTMSRTAAFISQLAHESGEFRWMEEIWGPTSAQRRYEPATDLSRRLGNTQPGDGKRFKGRGPIQLTGRANYQRFGKLLGIDLVAAPDRAAAPEVAFRVAALYWMNRGLNELADAQDFREITRRINGGFNGLADRQRYFERATAALASGFQRAVRMAAPGRRAAAAARRVPTEQLTRGFEAINELTTPKLRATKSATTKTATRKTTAGKGTAKAAASKTAVKKKRAPASKSTARKPAKRAPATSRAPARRR